MEEPKTYACEVDVVLKAASQQEADDLMEALANEMYAEDSSIVSVSVATVTEKRS